MCAFFGFAKISPISHTLLIATKSLNSLGFLADIQETFTPLGNASTLNCQGHYTGLCSTSPIGLDESWWLIRLNQIS